MTIKEKIFELGNKTGNPCVTISFNTNRTHPENEQDRVVLKNLLSEAHTRVVEQYGEKECEALLKRIAHVSDDIDIERNLESMHIFLSENTQEVVKTTWLVKENTTFIDNSFALRPLIEADARSEEYLLLLLSQGGVSLYEAINDSILDEIDDDDFPFSQTPHYSENAEQASDSEKQDNLVREYFNQVDKALVRVHKETGLKCVVVCTESNYSKLMQISDAPQMYLGHAHVDYNKCQPHEIVKQSWEVIKKTKSKEKEALLEEIAVAVSQGKIFTDLHEIFQAAIDGRADILLVDRHFLQPVRMTSDRTFELVDDAKAEDVIEDIVNTIAWEVIKNKGTVVFDSSDRLKDYGDIVLKARY